jgi:ElaB/YqjD/DUF883 family membrane-anchored ribosome-binding protein
MQFQSNTPEPAANGRGDGSTPLAMAKRDAALSGMSREFHALLKDIEDLIQATTSLSGEDLARVKAQLSERVAVAKQSVEKMGGVIAERARDGAKATDSYVHENPWQAVGIGAAAGVLLGLMLARRG